MMDVLIPGYGEIIIENLVLDFNGTIAKDGILNKDVIEPLRVLAEHLNIYVLTADTFGTVHKELANLPVRVSKLEKGGEEIHKKSDYIHSLGDEKTIALGNGTNDEGMLKAARIGVCIMGKEGCSKRALDSADLLVTDVVDALELLIYTDRLRATLRY